MRVFIIWAAWLMGRLRRPLSRLEAAVGLATGVMSVGGAALSFVGSVPASVGPVEVVAIVEEAQTRKPVAAATIEIVTPKDALVTTLTTGPDGRARYQLTEGTYRLNASHPGFSPAGRRVRVLAPSSSEVRLALRPIPQRSQPAAQASPRRSVAPKAPPAPKRPPVNGAFPIRSVESAP